MAKKSVRSAEKIVKKYTEGVSISKITPHKLRSVYAPTLYKYTSNEKYTIASDKNRSARQR